MKIFISYSSKNVDVAEDIYHSLVNMRHDVFFDRSSILGSEDYNLVIRNEIEKCDYFIFLISPASISKGYAISELKFIQEKIKQPKNLILPVLVEETKEKNIPSFLRSVSILKPSGNIAAEVAHHIAQIESSHFFNKIFPTLNKKNFRSLIFLIGMMLLILIYLNKKIVPDENQLLPDFFPMSIGTSWTYTTSGASIISETKSQKYTDIIVASFDLPIASEYTMIGIERIGGTSPCPEATPESNKILKGSPTYWWVHNKIKLYQVCSREEGYDLVEKLKIDDPEKEPPEPEYVSPIAVGKSWPTIDYRDDHFYRWYVEKKDSISTPAGKFNDCYRIDYVTLPDHTTRWVCKGIGLVKESFDHHGPLSVHTTELISYSTI